MLGKFGIDQTTPGTTNAVSVTNSSFAVTGTTVPTGAAGTANTAVVTMQGIAGGTPVPISGTITATTSGTATTAPPAYTNATANPLSLALSGGMRVAATISEYSADVVMQSAAVAVGNGTIMPIVGYGTSLINLTGPFVGTVAFEGTMDGTNYFPLSATQLGVGVIASTATVPGLYRSVCAGLTNLRVRISAWTSGSITATGRTTNTPLASKFIQLAAGINVVGAVTQSGTWNVGVTGSVAVTGTFFQATQPVSIATMPTTAVTGTFFQGTQPVSVSALPALTAGAAVIGAVTQSGTWNIGSITTVALPTGASTETTLAAASAKLPASLGAKPGATSLTTVAATDDYARLPAVSTNLLLSAAATTNGTSVKATAGAVKSVQGYNAKAAAVYLKLYNKASAPTVGTDVPVKTIYLPASSAFAFDFPAGYSFATGIAYALTLAAANADATALVSADIICLNVDYI